VRQAGRSDHQRGGDREQVDPALVAVRVGSETKLRVEAVQPVQQVLARLEVGGAEARLRKEAPGHQQRDEDRRHQVGEDQHAVLGDLGVGDALHAPQDGVEEHEPHADHHTEADVDLEEAAEDDSHPAHLPGYVGEGHEDRAHHGHDARDLRVVAIADEVGDGVLSELSQIGR
jgi:hypothetical protein